MAKTRSSLAVLVSPLLLLVASAASAQTLYDKGQINAQVNAWKINERYAVGDTLCLSNPTSTLTGLAFGVWLTPGDTLQSAEVSITSDVLGGTTYFRSGRHVHGIRMFRKQL